MISLKELKEKAAKAEPENRKLIQKLNKNIKLNLDKIFHPLHEEVASKIDCLQCANCCKSISPVITARDIEKISHKLKMKSTAFIEKYLHRDEEQDYVFNQTPCPFLQSDNFCAIYDYRPVACEGYPHTDRAKVRPILYLVLRNTFYCPIVFEIVESIKNKNKYK